MSSIRGVLERAEAALKLRGVNRVGAGAIVVGMPHIRNQGIIEIGRDFRLVSRPAISHLVVFRGGALRIGDRVKVERGASISAVHDVRIGNDVRMGPSVVIMDSDFHVVGNREAQPAPQPVVIGNGVVIEHRVTILRGSRIGDAARVSSGSVVSGDVAPGTTVAGVPAIPLGSTAANGDGDLGVRGLVQRVFGLPGPPDLSDGPDTISQWDSLGALKLLLAIEQHFGATLGDKEMRSARTIAEIEAIIARTVVAT